MYAYNNRPSSLIILYCSSDKMSERDPIVG